VRHGHVRPTHRFIHGCERAIVAARGRRAGPARRGRDHHHFAAPDAAPLQERARAPEPAPTRDEPLGRDRCTIVLAHRDPAGALDQSGRHARYHIVASDTSQESRHAVEWGIGTVFRDGGEMPIVDVKGMCPRSRHDAVLTAVQSAPARALRPLIARRRSATSRRYVAALDHFAYTHSLVHAALVRQATGLRQRTPLRVMWHMLLDLVDFLSAPRCSSGYGSSRASRSAAHRIPSCIVRAWRWCSRATPRAANARRGVGG
jgi:hypothetical protein